MFKNLVFLLWAPWSKTRFLFQKFFDYTTCLADTKCPSRGTPGKLILRNGFIIFVNNQGNKLTKGILILRNGIIISVNNQENKLTSQQEREFKIWQ